MKGICLGKRIVIGMKLTFGLFGCKTKCSCVYNKIAEKQGGCSSFSVQKIVYKLMR